MILAYIWLTLDANKDDTLVEGLNISALQSERLFLSMAVFFNIKTAAKLVIAYIGNTLLSIFHIVILFYLT